LLPSYNETWLFPSALRHLLCPQELRV
jgi:hypothetical protein